MLIHNVVPIDFQIAAHPENTALAHVVPLLLDSLYPDEKTYNEIKKAAEEMASAVSGGVSDTVLSTLSDSLLSGIDASPPSDWTAVVVASAASCQDLLTLCFVIPRRLPRSTARHPAIFRIAGRLSCSLSRRVSCSQVRHPVRIYKIILGGTTL